jgi:hypothetical protein
MIVGRSLVPREHFHGSGWAAIADAGVDGLCSLLAERSQSALPRLLGEGFVADAAFVGLPARSAGVRCPGTRQSRGLGL